ncbi:MAG: Hydrolase 4 protein [Gammaproteobacteria bacterium]|nr:Hydrolase 4 protein [Gammaproteobacteria bacterium]
MNRLSLCLCRLSVSIIALFLFSATLTAAPLAEFINYKAEDGANLNALLYLPQEPGGSVVILIPGGTGGFIDGFHDYTPLAEQLTAKGYAFLLANMRTAGTHGWYYDRFETAEQDVGAAVAMAKSRGLNRIILVGVSLGGPRAVYYWSQTREPSVQAIVFLASITSPYLEGRIRLDDKQRAAFDTVLEKARNLVNQGKGYESICFIYFGDVGECSAPGAGVTLSAASFISYFGTAAETNAVSIKFTGQVTLPVAVIHSKNDELARPPVAREIYNSLTATSRRDLIWIEEAGVSHYLSPGKSATVYAQAVVNWVLEVAPPN